MFKKFIGAAAVAASLVLAPAHAALVSSTLNGVTLLGTTYNVTFWQDSDGLTEFDQVFGSTATPNYFSAADAPTAATQLLAAVNAANFDVEPGSSDSDIFVLAFDVTATSFRWYNALTNDPLNALNGVFGPYTTIGTRATAGVFGASFVSLTPADATVPEPASLALVAVAGLGLVGTRRRRA